VLDQFSMFDDPPAGPPSPPAGMPSGSGGTPASPHSFFFAIVSNAADAAQLHARALGWDRALEVGGRLLEAERLHVSLHGLGFCVGVPPEPDIARWRRAATSVRCAPFDVRFDRVATFGGKGNPLVFRSSDDDGVAGLLSLHQALGMALADTGERIRSRRITPHMTLSYRGRRIADTAIEPVSWRACDLVLIDSHLGAHRHDVLGRWPLGD
jgi:RNA 2',3'-cyclic 3'-phosphodiesterase